MTVGHGPTVSAVQCTCKFSSEVQVALKSKPIFRSSAAVVATAGALLVPQPSNVISPGTSVTIIELVFIDIVTLLLPVQP